MPAPLRLTRNGSYYAALTPLRMSSVPGIQLYVCDTVLEGEPAALTASRYAIEEAPSASSCTNCTPSLRSEVSRAMVSRTNRR